MSTTGSPPASATGRSAARACARRTRATRSRRRTASTRSRYASGDGERLRVIGALRSLLVAPAEPEALLRAMSDPAVRIVSLTVTEKGYCHDPATGTLQRGPPGHRRRSRRARRAPRSAPGFLVEALRRRRAAGAAPFTVLCCDNLPANGHTVGRVVTRFAALRDPDLGRWIEDEVAFPSTMVDRIVPATTDADRAAVAARLGAGGCLAGR